MLNLNKENLKDFEHVEFAYKKNISNEERELLEKGKIYSEEVYNFATKAAKVMQYYMFKDNEWQKALKEVTECFNLHQTSIIYIDAIALLNKYWLYSEKLVDIINECTYKQEKELARDIADLQSVKFAFKKNISEEEFRKFLKKENFSEKSIDISLISGKICQYRYYQRGDNIDAKLRSLLKYFKVEEDSNLYEEIFKILHKYWKYSIKLN